jgi:hypothetical protein
MLALACVLLHVGGSPAHAANVDSRVKYVVVDPAYNVDVSVDTVKTLRVGIENQGPFVADLDVVILLTSQAGVCEARLIAIPGDVRVEELSGGNILSELDIRLSAMLPGETREIVRDYVVHCFSKSFHDNAIELDVGVAPVLPTGESNALDNAYIQYIDVTSIGVADVKYLGIVLNPEAVAQNEDAPVTVRSVLHNNGPFGPVLVDITLMPSLPPDCAISSPATLTASTNVPVSVAVSVDQVVGVSCSETSFHELCWAGSAGVESLHVEEPTTSNNSAASCSVHPVTGTYDLKIASFEVIAPDSAQPGANFDVMTDAVLHNNGPYASVSNASGSIGFSAPTSCSVDPAVPQPFGPATLPVSVAIVVSTTWSVNCPDAGGKGFFAAASVAAEPIAHVTEANGANNSAVASGSVQVSLPATPGPGVPLAIGGEAGLLGSSSSRGSAGPVVIGSVAMLGLLLLLAGLAGLRRRS